MGDSEFSGLFVNADEGVTDEGAEVKEASSMAVRMQYSNGYIEMPSEMAA